MIRFANIMQRLAANGYTAYRLRQEKLLSEGTLTRLRNGAPITTSTLDIICRLCHCQPGELLTWVPDETPEE